MQLKLQDEAVGRVVALVGGACCGLERRATDALSAAAGGRVNSGAGGAARSGAAMWAAGRAV